MIALASINALPTFKKSRVEIFLRDDKGNAVEGATVYFKSNDPGVLLPEAKQTNSTGKVEAYIRANIAGTKTITIEAEWYENASLIRREGTTRIFFIPQVTPVVTQAGKELLATFTYGEKALQTKGVVLGIKVRVKPEGETAPRPLKYAIVKGTKAQLEFEFIPSIKAFKAEKERAPYEYTGFFPVIMIDDGDDETSIDRSLDLSKRYINIEYDSGRFVLEGNTVKWNLASEPELIKLGTNRIKVVAASRDPKSPWWWDPMTYGPVISESNFLVYKELEQPTKFIKHTPILDKARRYDPLITPDGKAFIKDKILLFGNRDVATDASISKTLLDFKIRPVGYIREQRMIEGLSQYGTNPITLSDKLVGLGTIGFAMPIEVKNLTALDIEFNELSGYEESVELVPFEGSETLFHRATEEAVSKIIDAGQGLKAGPNPGFYGHGVYMVDNLEFAGYNTGVALEKKVCLGAEVNVPKIGEGFEVINHDEAQRVVQKYRQLPEFKDVPEGEIWNQYAKDKKLKAFKIQRKDMKGPWYYVIKHENLISKPVRFGTIHNKGPKTTVRVKGRGSKVVTPKMAREIVENATKATKALNIGKRIIRKGGQIIARAAPIITIGSFIYYWYEGGFVYAGERTVKDYIFYDEVTWIGEIIYNYFHEQDELVKLKELGIEDTMKQSLFKQAYFYNRYLPFIEQPVGYTGPRLADAIIAKDEQTGAKFVVIVVDEKIVTTEEIFDDGWEPLPHERDLLTPDEEKENPALLEDPWPPEV